MATQKELTARIESLLAEGRTLAAGTMTKSDKDRVRDITNEVTRLRYDLEMAQAVERIGGGSAGTKAVEPNKASNAGDLWSQAKAAGFDPKNGVTHVAADGYKALMAAGENSNIDGADAVSAFGRYARYAHDALPKVNIGTSTLIHELTQSARTLAAPEDMDLDYQGTSAKPESVVSAALETFEPVWIATVSETIPNSLFQQDRLRNFVNDELVHAVNLGIDDHVVDSLTAATGANTYAQGADDALVALRKAKTELLTAGYNPNKLLIHPTDRELIDVLRDGVDAFYAGGPFAGAQGTVWGVTMHETTAVTAGSPIMIDAGAFGYVGLGQMLLDADPYSAFTTNQTMLRAEVACVVVVVRGEAIQLISGIG